MLTFIWLLLKKKGLEMAKTIKPLAEDNFNNLERAGKIDKILKASLDLREHMRDNKIDELFDCVFVYG